MTDKELRELLADTAKLTAENSKQISRLGKQIGELGNKFGKYTESLFFPSIRRILKKRFGIETTARNVKHQDVELDAFGYANSAKNLAVVVEVKTELREEDLKDFSKKLERFKDVFPEHADKKIYGVIAAAILPDNLQNQALKNGLFVASVSDETFDLTDEPKTPTKCGNG
jgi:hypothetical protein